MRTVSPVATEHQLVRIGGSADGGYLVPDDLAGISALFSPGVADTADFESVFAARGVPCFLADYSVDAPPVSSPLFHFEKKYLGAYRGYQRRPGRLGQTARTEGRRSRPANGYRRGRVWRLAFDRSGHLKALPYNRARSSRPAVDLAAERTRAGRPYVSKTPPSFRRCTPASEQLPRASGLRRSTCSTCHGADATQERPCPDSQTCHKPTTSLGQEKCPAFGRFRLTYVLVPAIAADRDVDHKVDGRYYLFNFRGTPPTQGRPCRVPLRSVRVL